MALRSDKCWRISHVKVKCWNVLNLVIVVAIVRLNQLLPVNEEQNAECMTLCRLPLNGLLWLQVETINDQYMVAGGLPDRYIEHAAEVCSMALHLLNAVTGLTVPRRPQHVLQLRIGIHTGQLSVCLTVSARGYRSRSRSQGLRCLSVWSPSSVVVKSLFTVRLSRSSRHWNTARKCKNRLECFCWRREWQVAVHWQKCCKSCKCQCQFI